MEREYGPKNSPVSDIDLLVYNHNNLYCYEVKCNYTEKQAYKSIKQLNNHLYKFAKNNNRWPKGYRNFFGYMVYRDNIQHLRRDRDMDKEKYDLAVKLMLYEYQGQKYQRDLKTGLFVKQ